MRLLILLAALLVCSPTLADFRAFESVPTAPALEAELSRIADEVLVEFRDSKLTADNFSITLVDMSSPELRRASYHGRIPYHPASVVKAFYLVSAWNEIEAGRLKLDDELERGFRDMIVDSGNDATSYVVDRITKTSSGEELQGRAFRRFVDRRNLMNRYFKNMGYDISANGKTWCENVYGREKQILGPNREHRNRVTSDAVAALMLWIARRQAVSASASESMLSLMKRPIPADGGDKVDEQVVEFTGQTLPAGARLWSKAGWTSEVRHDATYVELPDGRRYVLAVLTRGASENKEILPAVSRRILFLMRR